MIVNGEEWPDALGSSRTWAEAQWAHLEGVGGCINTAPRPLTARRYERTGSFRDINASGSTTPITRRYLTLSQDHGIDPTNGLYIYLDSTIVLDVRPSTFGRTMTAAFTR